MSLSPDPHFAGRVALVTGAAQGIGFALAEMLLEHGARVVLTDRNAEGLEAAHARLSSETRAVFSLPLDVSDRAQVDAAVARIESEWGPIDLLAHAAGILETGNLLDVTADSWSRSFAVNVHGVFHVCQAVARRMAPRRRGSIVVIASNAGSTPRVGMGAYPASKAATIHFVRCLGLELAELGIRCNTVSPGSTDTPMQRAFWTDTEGEARTIRGALDSYRLGIPLGRIASPRDIASSAVFLLSDRARHITLTDLCVDGGATF